MSSELEDAVTRIKPHVMNEVNNSKQTETTRDEIALVNWNAILQLRTIELLEQLVLNTAIIARYNGPKS